MCVCGAGEGRGSVARQIRCGPTLLDQEELGGLDTKAHANIQGK